METDLPTQLLPVRTAFSVWAAPLCQRLKRRKDLCPELSAYHGLSGKSQAPLCVYYLRGGSRLQTSEEGLAGFCWLTRMASLTVSSITQETWACSVSNFLDYLSWGRKTFAKCGRCRSMGWGWRLNQEETVSWDQVPSSFYCFTMDAAGQTALNSCHCSFPTARDFCSDCNPKQFIPPSSCFQVCGHDHNKEKCSEGTVLTSTVFPGLWDWSSVETVMGSELWTRTW